MLETLVTSSVLIAALCVLRLTRGRVSARLIYALWLTAALRLMLPFSARAEPGERRKSRRRACRTGSPRR